MTTPRPPPLDGAWLWMVTYRLDWRARDFTGVAFLSGDHVRPKNGVGRSTMQRVKLVMGLLGVVFSGLLGCGDHEPGLPKSAKARHVPDAGQLDAEAPANEALKDAGPPVVEPLDAGPTDAAVPTTQLDASTSPGVPDAAVVDNRLDAGLPDSGAAVPDASVRIPKFVAADTLASALVRAGEPIAVTCLVLDEAYRSYVPPGDLTSVAKVLEAGAAAVRDDGAWIASRAGQLSFSCTFPALGIEDATPAVVKVLPGSAARVTAKVDRAWILAGESVALSCEVFDAWGNTISDRNPSMRSVPADARNTQNALVATYARSGSYDLHCDVDGAESTPAKLEVRPGLPSALQVARVPDRASYAIDEAIELTSAVLDRFGNPILDVDVPKTSEPPGTITTDGRFRFPEAGQYRLTATVPPPTEGGVVLSQSVDVLVDGDGPAIACDAPLDGEILSAAPGASITLRGSVTDPAGINELRVNGVTISVDSAGHFATTATTRFGVNFIDLVALDSGGRQSTRVCAFLLANRWAANDTSVEDTLSLRLRQPAIDDSSRDDLDSLADALEAVLSSSGLRDTIHNSLLSNRVLKSGCDQMLGRICLVSSEVTYLDTEIDGPSTTSLTLIDGGLVSRSLIENARVKVGVAGQIAGASYQTQGWFIFQSIGVDTIFDIEVNVGQPRVRVRPGSTSSTIGRIDTDFPGLDGRVLDFAVGLAGGVLRDYVALRVEAYVADNLGAVLDGAVKGLGVETLGKRFSVERLDAGAPIPLDFAAEFSSVSTDPQRMLFGMGTRFTAPAAHARPSLGAPIATTSHLLDVTGEEFLGVAVHDGIFNQGLHALWRGGYFDAALDGNAKGLGLPEGMGVSFSSALPPVAEILGDRVTISLGKVTANLTYAGMLTAPVPMTLGARTSMAVHLDGNVLVFDDFNVDELHLSIDAPDIDAFTRALLELAVPSVLEYVVANTLADALPALPIPRLALASTASAYGLPEGAALGIDQPSFAIEAPHFVLRGNSTLAPAQ